MGLLHDELKIASASLSATGRQGYRFDASKALTADGTYFVGLALDEDSLI